MMQETYSIRDEAALQDHATGAERACLSNYHSFKGDRLKAIMGSFESNDELFEAVQGGRIALDFYEKLVTEAEGIPGLSAFARCYFPKALGRDFEPKVSYASREILGDDTPQDINCFNVLPNGDLVMSNRVNCQYVIQVASENSHGEYVRRDLLTLDDYVSVIEPTLDGGFAFTSEGINTYAFKHQQLADGTYDYTPEHGERGFALICSSLQLIPEEERFLLLSGLGVLFSDTISSGESPEEFIPFKFKDFAHMLPDGSIVGMSKEGNDLCIFKRPLNWGRGGSLKHPEIIGHIDGDVSSYQTLPNGDIVTCSDFFDDQKDQRICTVNWWIKKDQGGFSKNQIIERATFHTNYPSEIYVLEDGRIIFLDGTLGEIQLLTFKKGLGYEASELVGSKGISNLKFLPDGRMLGYSHEVSKFFIFE